MSDRNRNRYFRCQESKKRFRKLSYLERISIEILDENAKALPDNLEKKPDRDQRIR